MINTENITTKSFFENAKKDVLISKERLDLLASIAKNITTELKKSNEANINFICTHNSRRSQMGQVWSYYAAAYFNLKNIHTFSGGTETTAFHKNTVNTLQQVGFEFNVIDFSHENPKYSISFLDAEKRILGFSKKYNDKENSEPFIAITTCGHADENCPFIAEASTRFHLPYVDPKGSDNTPQQDTKYLEINQEIAAEMFILFNEISLLLK